jgi:hypothetical protein
VRLDEPARDGESPGVTIRAMPIVVNCPVL